MCGIAGILTTNQTTQSESIVQKMLLSTKHRGPDASVFWNDTVAYLGHNRLSIIDLSQFANQPMQSSCGRFTIVFNGEIYNYLELKSQLRAQTVFKTESDTEVLLAAYQKWGSQVCEHLNGMFAFLIWDSQERSAFICRDRFGVKPFYYTFFQGAFYFASEIKAFFAAGIPKVENWKVWANYLSYGTYGMPHETFWSGINQIPAGHQTKVVIKEHAALTEAEMELVNWYDFIGRVNAIEPIDEKTLKNQYLDLLNDSIALRFRADVKVGFNISGGLDSSALLALVNKNFPENKTIEAFTFYSNNADYDELPWVEEMIALTGNPLNSCLLNVNEMEQLIQEVSYYQDEPYGGFPTIAYSLIFKEARKKNILVLLDGQGMDEAWAGYDYYRTQSGFLVQGTSSSPVRPEALDSEFRKLAEKEIYPEPFSDKLKNLQYRDIFYTKIPRALRFNDRNSMMHSTELREPFLDYRLVELAFAQDESIKIKGNQSKWMLRQIVKDYLGDRISLAPKRPLQTPQREWIKEQLRPIFSHNINEFANKSYMNKEAVLSEWSDYQNGSQDNSFYIWQWMNLNVVG
ncbi:MAG: Asparagine synthetase [Bacteroidota bacterium]|jgi:asparagine synthase (glutamine-hydrolysing)